MTLIKFPTDLAFLRAEFALDRFPDWTADAACRSASLTDTPKLPHPRAKWMTHLPGVPSDPHFMDDFAQIRDVETYPWPSSVRNAISVCDTCPVRAPCLAYAYETEFTRPDPSDSWASSFTPEPLKLRYGVWGGTPGPVRSHYAGFVDRLARCEDWMQRLIHRKDRTDQEEASA